MAPKSEKGKIFVNNIWWWKSLWDYVCISCSDIITKEQMRGGRHNDGILIDEAQCINIAERLNEHIKNGYIKECEENNRNRLESIPDKECSECNGTGIKNEKKCVLCNGLGKLKTEFFFPFNEENIKNFIEFISDSGGFEIL